MFCVECGSEEMLTDVLCRECFLRKHELVRTPAVKKVAICSQCEALARGTQWEDAGGLEAAVERTAVDSITYLPGVEPGGIEVQTEFHSDNLARVDMEIDVELEGFRTTVSRSVEVKVRRNSCTKCSRKAGNYFEAVVQVRGEDRPLSREEMGDIVAMIESRAGEMESGDRNLFIQRIEEVKGGRDIYVSNINMGRMLARMILDSFGGTSKSSSTQTGRKDGKDMHRLTFLVRLPPYRAGDYVMAGGEPHLVVSVTARKVRLCSLGSHEERTLSTKALRESGLRILGSGEIRAMAVLVSHGEGEVQLLHPVSLATIDVRLPPGAAVEDITDGDNEVAIVEVEGNVYIDPGYRFTQ